MANPPRALTPQASPRDYFGAELRRLRERAGLSAAQLGDRVHYSGDLIAKIEKAERWPKTDLAKALDDALATDGTLTRLLPLLETQRSSSGSARSAVAAPSLARGPISTAGEDMSRREILRTAARLSAVGALPHRVGAFTPSSVLTAEQQEALTQLRAALLGTSIGEPPGTFRLPLLKSLRAGVQRAWNLRQRARYAELGRLLPGMLELSKKAAADLKGADRDEAVVLSTHVLNAASSVLKNLGDTHLAVIAADRSIQAARTTDNPLVVAASAYRLSNVFLPAGCLAESHQVALSAADLLDPSSQVCAAEVATWGSLLLTASAAAARQGQVADSWELLGEAKGAARRLGREHADVHTIFGTTAVAIQAVELAAVLGDGREVLRRARTVDVDHMPAGLLERRTHLLINVARGQALEADDGAAVQTLLQAERLTPEELQLHHEARSLVLTLLARERRSAVPDLRPLAVRLRVAA